MKITARYRRPAGYGDRVPKNQNTFSSLRRRVVNRAVHAGWRWMQRAGAVTAETPGRLRFGAIGPATRLAFPQGTIFGEPWIRLGDHCIIAEQVTLTAGMMPDLDLGPDPMLVLGNGVVLGRGSHVIADTRITIGDDTFCGPGVYITSTNHSYDDPHEPVGKQWPRSAPVEIGPGCWLGTGAVILPGARLGRNVVVAAGPSYGARCPTTRWWRGRRRGSCGAGSRRRAGSRRCARPRRCR